VNIGSLLGGLGHGISAGIKYFVIDERTLVWAIRTVNTAALTDIAHVGALWLKEVADEAGNLLPGIEGAIITYALTGQGTDPNAGSRHATQAIQAKYGAAVDAWWKQPK